MRCHSYLYDDFSIISYQSDIIDSMSYLICIDDIRIVIDPHEDNDLLLDLGETLSLKVILTHEHFDHISGVNWLKSRFNTTVYASELCGNKLMSKRNGTELFPLLLIGDKIAYRQFKEKYQLPYRCVIDKLLCGDVDWYFGNCHIHIFETPGHSAGSVSVLLNNSVLFPGDILLGNEEEFRSIDADIETYKKVTLPKFIRLISDDIMVFPGHGVPGKLPFILEKQGFYYGT